MSNLLKGWQDGQSSRSEVYEVAEYLFDLVVKNQPNYPETDSRYVLVGVIEALELMYSQPTLKADIPALRHFLHLGQTNPIAAGKFIDNYWSNIDWASRLAQELDNIQNS